jgi:hypothetical protein
MRAGSPKACGRSRLNGQQKMLICGDFTGATGLEPATSGVTGRASTAMIYHQATRKGSNSREFCLTMRSVSTSWNAAARSSCPTFAPSCCRLSRQRRRVAQSTGRAIVERLVECRAASLEHAKRSRTPLLNAAAAAVDWAEEVQLAALIPTRDDQYGAVLRRTRQAGPAAGQTAVSMKTARLPRCRTSPGYPYFASRVA